MLIINLLSVQFSLQSENLNTAKTSEQTAANGKNNSLGFIVKRTNLKLPTLTQRQYLKLWANIGFTETEMNEEILKATAEINKLSNIKALTETGEVPSYLARHISFIKKEYDNLKKEIQMLLGYKDSSVEKGESLKCEQTLPGINKAFLQAFTADIKTNIAFIERSLTLAELLN